ncbi:ferredoxin [Nocardia sp. BMG51109]|uniref:ferredoxin n=1 Tax=Nocardia sp. BMG51109 TaxID=1056816 RepID=UPI000465F90A|nr:ferredoxin [Nocardia sp. BMG51109]
MRIRLDRTLCDGFGVCAKHAPKHFSLDDWGYASPAGDGEVEPADHDDVQRALLDCPVHAITVLPDRENGTPPAVSRATTADREPSP